MRLLSAFLLSLLLSVGAGSQESSAQGISDCPTSTSFQGGYCRYDSRNQTAIVFVHGVLGDYKSTWTNDGSKQYWPSLLAHDSAFTDANIYVHRFVSPKIDVAQRVEELAVRLGDYLDADKVITGHSRVVFIAHSMGGLIVRALLVQRRIPPGKVPLIYFFGTPSAGANLANVGALVSSNPQFRDMLPFGAGGYVEELALRWLSTSQDQLTAYPRTIWSYCAYEKKGVLGKIIVDEFSAIFLCNVQPRAVLSDHIDMVKPIDPTAEPYRYFSAAYRFVRSEAGQNVWAGLVVHPFAISMMTVHIGRVGENALRLKHEPVASTRFDVGCEQRKSGILEVPLKVEPTEKEELFTARATWTTKNVFTSLFAIEAIRGNSVRLRYLVEGLPLFLNACPGEGSAEVVINYVTVRPARDE